MFVHSKPLDYLKLGASLYVPATHKNLLELAAGKKHPALKSLIIDTEDAVAADELDYAYHNIERFLRGFGTLSLPRGRPLLFVRTRNLESFEHILHLEGIELCDGFVFPKFYSGNMEAYMKRLPNWAYCMPVLEKHIFNHGEIDRIRDYLLPRRANVLSVRIGATDLLSDFNLRRDCRTLIYNIGVIKHIITQIVLSFRPHGFNISAPVYECFAAENFPILQEEVRLDLLSGLFGKTVIHPAQIDVVQEIYRVNAAEHAVACKLLDPEMPAVFKLHGQMHEKATHSGWARCIIERARLYGMQRQQDIATLYCRA